MILAHGAGQGMESPFMTYFHTGLRDRGYLSVQFNFEYMDAGRRVPDPQPKLQARYRKVAEEVILAYRPERLIIGGKSMGGRVASFIAADTHGIHALVFLGYPLHPPGRPDQLRDQHLYGLKLPMLFLSGRKDPLARPDLLQAVVARIGSKATLAWIEGGDHSLKRGRNDRESLILALDTMDQWMRELH